MRKAPICWNATKPANVGVQVPAEGDNVRDRTSVWRTPTLKIAAIQPVDLQRDVRRPPSLYSLYSLL
jgi:hypothetical protein